MGERDGDAEGRRGVSPARGGGGREGLSVRGGAE